jgi:hypothetical protein
MIRAERRALRRRDVKAIYGASLQQIDRAISDRRIETKKIGRSVFLNPRDVEALFGFGAEPSQESVAEMWEFLQ